MAILILGGHMGHQIVPLIFTPGFGGSRIKIVATRATCIPDSAAGFSRYMALGATIINIWTWYDYI